MLNTVKQCGKTNMWSYQIEGSVPAKEKINGFEVRIPTAVFRYNEEEAFRLYSKKGYVMTSELSDKIVTALNKAGINDEPDF